MADIFTKKKRSEVMSAIKGKGNKTTEIELIKLFRQNGIKGWRRNCGGMVGKPDFIFPNQKVAVFVDGCFWHGCRRHRSIPASNRKFWLNKIENNRRRDALVNRLIKRNGWTVFRIWEHSLKGLLKP